MANFNSSLYYILNNNGNGTFSTGPQNSDPTTATDNQPDGTFSTSDRIDTNSPISGPFTYDYAGSYQDGWIGYDGFDNYLFTNTNYASVQTFALNTSPFTVCFLTGTMIATPDGERAVETLRPGDLVTTSSGEERPVRWMGRQTIFSIFADRLRSYPVRIAAGALDENVPTRDLHVSPDHALLVDGVLAHAGALVNGTSIVRIDDVAPSFVYHHIELEDHALVLAEGAPAETFVDSVTRRRFDNYAEYEALFGEEQPGSIAEHDAPRALSARQIDPATRARLAARAAGLGLVERVAA